MKKIIIAVTALAITAASFQSARAGDREWATVGKILTGVAVAGVVASAVDTRHSSYTVTYSSHSPAPVRYIPAPVVCAPAPVVCAPAPRVVYVPAPVVYRPQPVYVTTYAPREHRGHGYGHYRPSRNHCR